MKIKITFGDTVHVSFLLETMRYIMDHGLDFSVDSYCGVIVVYLLPSNDTGSKNDKTVLVRFKPLVSDFLKTKLGVSPVIELI